MKKMEKMENGEKTTVPKAKNLKPIFSIFPQVRVSLYNSDNIAKRLPHIERM